MLNTDVRYSITKADEYILVAFDEERQPVLVAGFSTNTAAKRAWPHIQAEYQLLAGNFQIYERERLYGG